MKVLHFLLLPFLVSSSLVNSPVVRAVGCPLYPFCGYRPGVIGSFHHAQDFSLIGYPTPGEMQTGLEVPSMGKDLRNIARSTCEFENYFCEPLGPEIIALRSISSSAECQTQCHKTENCNFFSFISLRGGSTCSLLKGCSRKERRCSEKEKCVSGPSNCNCKKLERNPEDSYHTEFARWRCSDSEGEMIDPYVQQIPLWSTCIASCSKRHKSLLAPIMSRCLPNGEWSTSEPSSEVSLKSDFQDNFWPQPDQADLVCGCKDIRVEYDPNDEEGAEFVCSENGKNIEIRSGLTIKTGYECLLKCSGSLVALVSCKAGVWSGEPEKGFYCYQKPQVLRGTIPFSQAGFGSCVGHCGEGSGAGMNCFCDLKCKEVGDCCQDYVNVCEVNPQKSSCEGRCQITPVTGNTPLIKRAGCHCDSYCFKLGDCCPDFFEQCFPASGTTTETTTTALTTTANIPISQIGNRSGSCIGHCGGASMGCFCDSNCSKVGDCCEDYALVCAKQSTKTSCQGGCGSSSKLRRISVRKGGDCNCDKYCSKVGDCCQDYYSLCQPSHSCKGRCKSTYLRNSLARKDECNCDPYCYAARDCCSDYQEECYPVQPTTPTTTSTIITIMKDDIINSCTGRCIPSSLSRRIGERKLDNCHCDKLCTKALDCCSDYNQVCFLITTTSKPVIGTCNGRCGVSSNLRRLTLRTSSECQCDAYCSKIGDCCPDYFDTCLAVLTTTTTTTSTTTIPTTTKATTTGSCSGNCGGKSLGCFCDSGCDRAGDCCADYEEVCMKTVEPSETGNDNNCGIRGPPSKVVGGWEAKRNDYTWMALLTKASHHVTVKSPIIPALPRTHKPFCGGTLVSKYWIVTASHCTSGGTPSGKYLVVLGEWDRELEFDTYVRVHHVVERFRHPDYNTANYDNDIALWKLKEPADLTHFRLACLPVKGLKVNNPLTVAGWGILAEGGLDLANVLQEVNVPLATLDTCRKAIGSSLTSNQLCAGGVKGQDACQGDSGGPLMGLEPSSNKIYLAGVVSWGIGCGREGLYGVYTKVSNYRDWINDHINNG